MLFVDPSYANRHAYSVFSGDQLLMAGIAPRASEGHISRRATAGLHQVLENKSLFGELVKAQIELPQVYGREQKRPIPVEDILKLSVSVGTLIEMLEVMGVPTLTVQPKRWKGNLPKPVMKRRFQQILRPEEWAVISTKDRDNHDVLDAIGIGLSYVGRFR